MIIDNKEKNALISLFSSEPYGAEVLEILRRESGIDLRTKFNEDARRQDYNLGRASLFADIEQIIKKGKHNGKSRRKQSEPEF